MQGDSSNVLIGKELPISVLMPVYNMAGSSESVRMLEIAIDSILCQTFCEFEFVIVDDGSTDSTRLILSHFSDQDCRIRVVQTQSHVGISDALNFGLSCCSGRWVARQDADDYSLVTRLFDQIGIAENDPHLSVLGTLMMQVDAYGNLIKAHLDRPLWHREIVDFIKYQGCPIPHGSAFVRRSDLIEVGGYDNSPEWQHAEDYFLWAKMASHGKVFGCLNQIEYAHRTHHDQISIKNHKAQQQATIRIKRWAQQNIK